MKKTVEEIKTLADHIRMDILDMTYRAGVNGGHLGGALSSADILAVLYGEILKISADRPAMPYRDRFLLSKGHIALAHYAVLAETGFIPKDDLALFEMSGSSLPTHEVMDVEKGIEISSGSLGYGLSIGVGIALESKRSEKGYKTYVLLGDGESNEGTVWEAAMSAVRFRLDDLVVIVDANGQSLDGNTEDIMPIKDMAMVWGGFGFHVVEVDGHDIISLYDAMMTLPEDRPTVVIAHTIKGKGIPSIEGKIGWHHVHLSKEQYEDFKKELEGAG